MGYELDHVFVAVSRGAPGISAVLEAGFAEGLPNTHPGQGTACRRFFFENAYLEFVWLENPADASSPLIEPTGLARRIGGQDGASRVGVCLRPEKAGQALPIDTWDYRPPYLPGDTSIPVATSSTMLHEPLIFFLPRAGGVASGERHPNGAQALTDVQITLPEGPDLSLALEWLSKSGLVRLRRGRCEEVTAVLDHASTGNSLRLAVPTPLILRW